MKKLLAIMLILNILVGCENYNQNDIDTQVMINDESAKNIKKLNSQIILRIESLELKLKERERESFTGMINDFRDNLYNKSNFNIVYHLESLTKYMIDTLKINKSKTDSISSKFESIKSFENRTQTSKIIYTEILLTEILFVYSESLVNTKDLIEYSIPLVFKEEVGKDSTNLFITNKLVLNNVANKIYCNRKSLTMRRDSNELLEYYKVKISNRELKDSIRISSTTTNIHSGIIFSGSMKYGK